MRIAKNKIIRVVLPALLLVLLLSICATVAFAEEPVTHKLTVDFGSDPSLCQVTYSVDGGEAKKLSHNETVEIPRSATVVVNIKPNNGYELAGIYDVLPGGVEQPRFSSAFNSFNADSTLRLAFSPKTFNIVFEPIEGEDAITYNFPDGKADQYKNLTYTFGAPAITIDPVVRSSGGYTFDRWEVVDGDKAHPLDVEADGTLKFSLLASGNVYNSWQESGTIHLRPVFTPVKYDVYRYDYVVSIGPGSQIILSHLLNANDLATWKAPMGSEVSGALTEGEVTPYQGYVYYGFDGNKKVDTDANKVYRYFVPIEYELLFDWNGGAILGSTQPDKHIYDVDTPLPGGTRTGYTFGGWSVWVKGVEVDQITDLSALKLMAGAPANTPAYAEGNNEEKKITLKAIWNPITYDITYDFSGWNQEQNTHLPLTHTYGTDTTVPTPIRNGYTFVGWLVNDTTEWKPGTASELVLSAEGYVANISLKAIWKANTYSVQLLSPDGSPASQIISATFDAPLVIPESFIKPTRAQYKFLGFFHENGTMYIDSEGKSVCSAWDQYAPDTVLTARWELLPMMPDINPDDYKIDYPGEIFNFPAGKYTIVLGEDHLSFTVTDVSTQKIPNSFFGNTVELIIHTTKPDTWSDYHGTIVLAARPKAPSKDYWDYDKGENVIGEIDTIRVWDDKTMEVLFKDGIDSSIYEFALSMDGGETMMRDWQSSPKFTDLYPGTPYHIFVRVKATETAPHGLAYSWQDSTSDAAYRNDLIDQLNGMIREEDGEMLRILIAKAISDINALQSNTATFYVDAEKIMEAARTGAVFARLQDEKLASLAAYRDALLATDAYHSQNAVLITTLCQNAIDAIKQATVDTQVNALYEDAYEDMTQVPISYLHSGNLFLTAPGGLFKDTVLTVVRYPDFSTQMLNVSNSIAAGKVVYNGTGLTPRELLQLLESQEVIGAYSMKLTMNGATLGAQSEQLQMRLLLPEELRDAQGLRVAYYDAATGTLTVLETQKEGDYLLFTAPIASDFVILGDPVMSLTLPIVALSLVALCQLIAIAVLLVSRIRDGRAVRHAGVAMPLFLTVQFLPAGGELAVLILGALVIILQIVLIYLLLTSEVVHKSLKTRRRRHEEASKQEDQYAPVFAPRKEAEEAVTAEEDVTTAYAAVALAEDAVSADEPLSDIEEDEAPQTEEDSRIDDIWAEPPTGSSFDFYDESEEAVTEDTEEPLYEETDEDEADLPEAPQEVYDSYGETEEGQFYVAEGEYPGYSETDEEYSEEYIAYPGEEYTEVYADYPAEESYPEDAAYYAEEGVEDAYQESQSYVEASAYEDADAMGQAEEGYYEEEEYATGDIAEDDLYNIPENAESDPADGEIRYFE